MNEKEMLNNDGLEKEQLRAAYERVLSEHHGIVYGPTPVTKQDYAKILFELSRAAKELEEEILTTVVERLWCGDVAQYIVGLENELRGKIKLLVLK